MSEQIIHGQTEVCQPSGEQAAESLPQTTGEEAVSAETAVSDVGTQEPDRRAAFEELIKGEYKQEYEARVQELLRKRLKNTKQAAEQAQEENRRLKQQLEDHGSQQRIARRAAELRKQEQEAKAVYPGLDVAKELQDPRFVKLLRADVDIRTAYEVLHRSEILPAAMAYTARQVERKLTNHIAAGNARPAENGMAGQSAALIGSDVSQLSRAQRQEIIRRVQGGEKIRF